MFRMRNAIIANMMWSTCRLHGSLPTGSAGYAQPGSTTSSEIRLMRRLPGDIFGAASFSLSGFATIPKHHLFHLSFSVIWTSMQGGGFDLGDYIQTKELQWMSDVTTTIKKKMFTGFVSLQHQTIGRKKRKKKDLQPQVGKYSGCSHWYCTEFLIINLC